MRDAKGAGHANHSLSRIAQWQRLPCHWRRSIGASAEGATRDEALKNLKDEIQARIRSGAELVALEVGVAPHPWLEFAGMYKDDPLIEEWKKAMADYRDQVEKDDDYR